MSGDMFVSQINFGDGIPEREEDYTKVFTPEKLVGKTCGGCVRCAPREKAYGEEGYHCTCKSYEVDIHPEDPACEIYWDRAEHEEIERLRQEDTEKRRQELWAIYADKEPVELPIVNDGYGRIPMCPICGEMPYSTEQCHWCGQRFIQTEAIKAYSVPETVEMVCFS